MMSFTKICSRCKIEKGTEEFYKDKNTKRGLTSWCKSCAKEKDAKWRAENRERKKETSTKWYAENRERRKEYLAKWRTENKHYSVKWRAKNGERKREYNAKWQQNKYHNDISYKLRSLLRNRIRSAIKKGSKSARTLGLLGCSVEEVKRHLESQFKDGMSWENHGEWHIDHIVPCASFDLTDPEQQKQCFHYSNLQPLWATENMEKGAKLDYSIE